MASLLQVIVGMSGAIGFLLRFVGPLAITPTITLIGVSLFDDVPNLAEQNWWMALGYVVPISESLETWFFA